MHFLNRKLIKFVLAVISIFLIIFYISRNKEFIEIYRDINYYYLYFVLILIVFRIYLHGVQNSFLYKIAKVNLTVFESMNLYLRTILGNYISFLQPGSGYKIAYLKLQHKLPVKDFFYLNIGLTTYRIILYTIFIMIYLVLQNFLSTTILLTTIALALVIVYVFKNYLKNIINEKFELNIKSFNYLNLIIIFQLLINSYIFYLYFKILDLQNSISEILIFFLVGTISDIIKITPGNIGFRETILILFESLHNILPSEILAVSFFARFTEVIFYTIVALIFVYIPFNNKEGNK